MNIDELLAVLTGLQESHSFCGDECSLVDDLADVLVAFNKERADKNEKD